MGMVYAVPLQKTHNLTFENRQVFYQWHRWYGRTVMTRAACGAHADQAYLCKLPEAPFDVMLIEIPKWMFDAAHCSTLRLMDIPRVDCETLRDLKAAIARFRVSLTAAMLQPQISRPAGDGDTDDSDSPDESKKTAVAVQRTARGAKLERSQRPDAPRRSQTARSAACQRSDKPYKSRPSPTRRAR